MPDIGAAVSLILDDYPAYAAIDAPLAETVAQGDLVLIGGLARSGKSRLAATLRTALRQRGVAATSLSLDRCIRPEAERRPGVLGRFDLDAMRTALGPWFDGGAVDVPLPHYDRTTRRVRPGDTLNLDADTALILEGVPALLLPGLTTDRRVHTVFVVADEDARHARVVDDLVARGLSTAEEAEAFYRSRQHDEAAEVLAAPRAQTIWSLDSARQEAAA